MADDENRDAGAQARGFQRRRSKDSCPREYRFPLCRSDGDILPKEQADRHADQHGSREPQAKPGKEIVPGGRHGTRPP